MDALPATAVAVLLLLAGLAALAPAGADEATPHTFCVFVDTTTVTGHTFAQVIPGTGPQAGNRSYVYGHYPDGPDAGSASDIRSDAQRTWTWKICWKLTAAAYNRIVAQINADITNPPEYHFTGHNCQDWATSIGINGGITVPAGTTLGVSDPDELEDALKAAGHGGTLNGGTVKQNMVPGSTASSAPDPPFNRAFCSPTGVADFMLDGGLVAPAYHHWGYAPQSRPPIQVGAGQPLRLMLSSPLQPATAVVAVEWGDGAPRHRSMQLPDQPQHVYAQPGEYQLRVRGLQGDFHETVNHCEAAWDIKVEVLPAGGPAQVPLGLPPQGPRVVPFVDFGDPGDPFGVHPAPSV